MSTSPATREAIFLTMYCLLKYLRALRQDSTSSAQMQVLGTLGPSDKKLIRKTKGLSPSKNKFALSGQPVLTPART